ncbi:UNVERIFIED_CONTAM: hypothetical protein Slati_1767500 [Sesamum latifolium]|uniref:Retrotransposon gag domain-containing protein n=1 Tax=Sesamum latifolium TaxID=2727402 RepID=A0AAW2X2W8_9LAMI
MEGDTPRREEDPSRQTEPVMQITRSELRRLMEEAGRNALVQHERRTVTPLAREAPRRRLFKEREVEREQLEATSREEPEKGQAAEGSEVGSSERERGKRREPGISRAEVDDVGRQIERLEKQIDELKRRGEIVEQNRNSPFSNKILTEVVDPSFRMLDLPKYDGTKDRQEHIAAFELKFTFHFASKRKQKRSATYLFNIRQKEDESLKSFIGRFNNETLEVQDLRIDMMVSILIHGLRKGPLASALARDPPEDVEQLMRIAQKYIDEEEINAMKDGEWQRSRDRGRGKDNREKHVRADKEREPPYRPKFHRYTPLATTRTKALMMVEKSDLLQCPQHTRFTPAKRFSNKYCKFHREKGHDTKDCYQLKDEIERLVRQGYFKEFILEQGSRSRDHKVGDRRTRSRSISRERFKEDDRKDRGRGSVGSWSNRERKRYERNNREDRRKELVLSVEPEEEITSGAKDLGKRRGSQDDPMVIKLDIANFSVHKVLVDNGSSADIIFWDVIKRIGFRECSVGPSAHPISRIWR